MPSPSLLIHRTSLPSQSGTTSTPNNTRYTNSHKAREVARQDGQRGQFRATRRWEEWSRGWQRIAPSHGGEIQAGHLRGRPDQELGDERPLSLIQLHKMARERGRERVEQPGVVLAVDDDGAADAAERGRDPPVGQRQELAGLLAAPASSRARNTAALLVHFYLA